MKNQLIWTKNKPTRAGFYWHIPCMECGESRISILEVKNYSGYDAPVIREYKLVIGNSPLADWGGWWSNEPIQMPIRKVDYKIKISKK